MARSYTSHTSPLTGEERRIPLLDELERESELDEFVHSVAVDGLAPPLDVIDLAVDFDDLDDHDDDDNNNNRKSRVGDDDDDDVILLKNDDEEDEDDQRKEGGLYEAAKKRARERGRARIVERARELGAEEGLATSSSGRASSSRLSWVSDLGASRGVRAKSSFAEEMSTPVRIRRPLLARLADSPLSPPPPSLGERGGLPLPSSSSLSLSPSGPLSPTGLGGLDPEVRREEIERMKQIRAEDIERSRALLEKRVSFELKGTGETPDGRGAAEEAEALREQVVEMAEEPGKKAEAKAAQRAGESTKLVDIGTIPITGHDMRTLSPGGWLNDEVVNGSVALMQIKADELAEAGLGPKIHFFNSFFYLKLFQRKQVYNFRSVRRWTKKFDPREMDKIVFPVHLGNHWTLAVINLRDKAFEYYDSLLHPNQDVIDSMKAWVVDEMRENRSEEWDVSSWSIHVPQDIPIQRNGFDCGVFALTFALFTFRDLPLSFSQSDMPSLRLFYTLSLLQKSLI